VLFIQEEFPGGVQRLLQRSAHEMAIGGSHRTPKHFRISRMFANEPDQHRFVRWIADVLNPPRKDLRNGLEELWRNGAVADDENPGGDHRLIFGSLITVPV